jgi:hypothetical protein
MNHRQAGILCLVFAGFLLIVGWWPFIPFPRNHVSWLTGRHGLAFEPPGVVYDAEPLLARAARPSDNPAPGFAVELSLEPATDNNAVPHILTIHDGRTPSTLSLVTGNRNCWCACRLRATKRFREAGIAVPKASISRHRDLEDSSATTFYIDGGCRAVFSASRCAGLDARTIDPAMRNRKVP